MLFYSYIFVTSVVVLNVVTGIFVHNSIEITQQDSEQLLNAHERDLLILHELFDEIDSDNSGNITFQKLESPFDELHIKAYFTMLDLDIVDAWSLFKLLDADGTGIITLDMFTDGCLRLKGDARRIDISNMMYTSKWTMDTLSQFATKTEHDMAQITVLLRELSSEIHASKKRTPLVAADIDTSDAVQSSQKSSVELDINSEPVATSPSGEERIDALSSWVGAFDDVCEAPEISETLVNRSYWGSRCLPAHNKVQLMGGR
jgi:hypothetical protein